MTATAQQAETIYRMFELYGLDYETLKANPGSLHVSERVADEVIATADELIQNGTDHYGFASSMQQFVDGLATAQRQSKH